MASITMSRKVANRVMKYSLWISLLLHLLFLCSFTLVLVGAPEQEHEKPPSMYVPSYVYHEQSKPAEKPQPEQKPVPMSKQGIEKPTAARTASSAEKNSQPQETDEKQTEEPIHLIGDKKTTPKPLIKLLGQALARHLVYPKIAEDFRVTGTVYIGFNLRPDGIITNVHVVKTSNTGVLDDEARSAVGAMSPIANVGLYLDKPKDLIVGIIFD